MFGISTEILSLLGSSIMGFALKMYAIKVENEKVRWDRAMQAIDKADSSADKAAARTSGSDADAKSGRWIRRFIVISVLFAVVAVPFIMALINTPVVAQLEITRPQYLFGLFGGGTKTVFVEVKGFLMIPEIRQVLICLCGFYFGQASARVNG